MDSLRRSLSRFREQAESLLLDGVPVGAAACRQRSSSSRRQSRRGPVAASTAERANTSTRNARTSGARSSSRGRPRPRRSSPPSSRQGPGEPRPGGRHQHQRGPSPPPSEPPPAPSGTRTEGAPQQQAPLHQPGWQRQLHAWEEVAHRYNIDSERYDEFSYLCYLDWLDPFVQNYVNFHKNAEVPLFKNRLRSHVSFWRELNAPPWLLDMIGSGVKIPFENNPPTFMLPNSKSVMDPVHVPWIRATLTEFLKLGFVSVVSEPPHCVLPLQLKNTSGKLAIIYDMSPLNDYVQKASFKLEGWEEMLDYSIDANFGVQFDLKKFYHQIDIADSFKKYFGFMYSLSDTADPVYFVWNTLPYGYTRAPFLARSLLKFGHESCCVL